MRAGAMGATPAQSPVSPALALSDLALDRSLLSPPGRASRHQARGMGEQHGLRHSVDVNPGPGAEVNPAWTLELAKMPRIKYVKESSRDLARVSRLIVEIDLAGHARYFTTMQMLLATIQLGGSGATMPPPGARIARAVIDAFLADDHQRAAELQRQFALFPARWMGYGLAPALKAAMEIVGLPLGDPYPPFQAVNAKDKEAMAEHLKTTYLFEEAPKTGGGKEKAA